MRRQPPTVPGAVLRAELARAERARPPKRDPEFLLPGSDVSIEHARVNRRLAVLRAELAGGTGRRDPIRIQADIETPDRRTRPCPPEPSPSLTSVRLSFARSPRKTPTAGWDFSDGLPACPAIVVEVGPYGRIKASMLGEWTTEVRGNLQYSTDGRASSSVLARHSRHRLTPPRASACGSAKVTRSCPIDRPGRWASASRPSPRVGGSELRVTLGEYQGRPFISLRRPGGRGRTAPCGRTGARGPTSFSARRRNWPRSWPRSRRAGRGSGTGSPPFGPRRRPDVRRQSPRGDHEP